MEQVYTLASSKKNSSNPPVTMYGASRGLSATAG